MASLKVKLIAFFLARAGGWVFARVVGEGFRGRGGRARGDGAWSTTYAGDLCFLAAHDGELLGEVLYL